MEVSRDPNAMDSLEVIALRKRPLWRRYLRLPWMAYKHHRRGLPWLVSARLALVTVKA